MLAVPMLKDDEVVGIFTLYRQEIRPFPEKQIELVKNFAAQAVIAIENARLLSELRESLQQQTATADVLRVISSSPGELQPVFDAVLKNAVDICDAKFGNIYLWDGGTLQAGAALNTPPAFAELRKRESLRPTSINPISQVIATKKPVHVADAAQSEAYMTGDPAAVASVELAGLRTFLGVPLVRDDQVVGAFTLGRQEVRPFTDKQIDLVKNFAAQAVIAIENARLLSELRKSLQQQTATADVLRVISSSPSEYRARS